ncbi:hypothetical protein [Azospirillum soli]|uniref:hypothetical protein n=1 Tax=Azospirillum soli TaxID=1304799 RepID=UPI001AE6BDF7|nr:hypothetical protein [Azospirillum soli]MBP2316910.1 hypothetical protein [Azospirillum soli]
MTVRLLSTLLAGAVLLGACAQPEVLSRPLPTPTMALPSGDAPPLPSYAQKTGEEAASMTLGDGADDAADWLGEWLAAVPHPPRSGTFRQSDRQLFGPQGLAASRAGTLYTRPDGGWTRRDNDVFLHSDGSSTVRRGDVFFHSDGTWSRRSGQVILRSDGSSCRLAAGAATCF